MHCATLLWYSRGVLVLQAVEEATCKHTRRSIWLNDEYERTGITLVGDSRTIRDGSDEDGNVTEMSHW